MHKVVRLVASAVVSLGFVSGIAAAQSITNTGPWSDNLVLNKSSNHLTVTNHNNVSASNHNYQSAYTGDAKVKYNTTGGDATSGDASNHNSLNASLSVDNSGACGCLAGFGSGFSGGGSINTTGPYSDNKIINKMENNVTVTNENNVSVSNSNEQRASSGDAYVSYNTTGGSATSGNASNTNNTTLDLTVQN